LHHSAHLLGANHGEINPKGCLVTMMMLPQGLSCNPQLNPAAGFRTTVRARA